MLKTVFTSVFALFFFSFGLCSTIYAEPSNLDLSLQNQSCTQQQADSGDPQACTLSGQAGFTFLRYASTDASGNFFCHRTICLDSNGNPLVPPSPTTEQQTPTTTPPPDQKYPSSEEQAIYNQCQFNSPNGVCPTPSKGNFFQNLLSIIKSLFHFPAQNPPQVASQSAQLHQNNFPKDLQPNNPDPGQNIDPSLGTDNGYYSINLPALSDQTTTKTDQDVYQKELIYEQSNFPPDIHPITQGPGQ